MARKLKYPISIETFSDIIEGGYVYVDKTSYIPMLLDSGKQYFLSRPRRFGKSLFVSTLKAYFEGRRELFKGLDIDKEVDVDWMPRPVFKFSFNALDALSENSLVEYLSDCLTDYEVEYGVESKMKTLSRRFVYLLKKSYADTGQKPVVLIDEYDAPLLATLEKTEFNDSYRNTLKAFFSVLKSSGGLIHFAFVTGETPFFKSNLLYEVNHFIDISFDEDYLAICGITKKDVQHFVPESETLQLEQRSVALDDDCEIPNTYFDVYQFSENNQKLFNNNIRLGDFPCFSFIRFDG